MSKGIQVLKFVTKQIKLKRLNSRNTIYAETVENTLDELNQTADWKLWKESNKGKILSSFVKCGSDMNSNV